MVSRRSLIASMAASAVGGCAAALPGTPPATIAPDAQALLDASAAAHGAAALATLNDVNVGYDGHWHALVNRLQPALVDAGYRGRSQERLLLRAGLVGQAHSGPAGHKQVVRGPLAGSVQVWVDGQPSQDPERLAAAALVADGYSLFLLGPMLLTGRWQTQRRLAMQVAATDTVAWNGQSRVCDVVRLRMTPGLGLSAADDLAVYIGQDDRLMHRVRFTLNGLASTRGAVAEVDTADHLQRGGITWPTRFRENLLRPLPLPVHDWALTGLDVNRQLSAADIDGPMFLNAAVKPATAL